MIHSLRRGAKAIGATVTAVGLAAAFAAAPAGAATQAGNLTIDVAGTTTPLTGPQSSSTIFSVSLPTGSACAQSTAAAQWHVWTFMVPVGTDPGTISFTGTLPSNNLGYFHDPNGDYVGPLNTSSTGLIIGLPNDMQWGSAVDFGNTDEPTLTGGSTKTWVTGVACVDQNGVMQTYYAQNITFNHTTADPGGRSFEWTPIPASPPLVPESPLTIALPIGGFAVLGLGVYVNRRRSNRRRGAVTVA